MRGPLAWMMVWAAALVLWACPRAGVQCGPQQREANGVCANLCNSAAECRAEEACVDGVCVPAVDAGIPSSTASGAAASSQESSSSASSAGAPSSSASNSTAASSTAASSSASASSGASSASSPAPLSSSAAQPSSGGAASSGAAGTSSSAAPVTPICDPGDTDLVFCFTFDGQGAEAFRDQGPAGNHLSATGVQVVPGRRGGAASMASGSVLALPDAPSLYGFQSFTLAGWVRLRSLPTGMGRMGLLDRDGDYGAFVLAGTGLRCALTAVGAEGPALPTAGPWHAFACRLDGNTYQAFLDGAGGLPVGATPVFDPGVATRLGSNAPSGDVLDGELDEVMLWKRALSNDELRALAGR